MGGLNLLGPSCNGGWTEVKSIIIKYKKRSLSLLDGKLWMPCRWQRLNKERTVVDALFQTKLVLPNMKSDPLLYFLCEKFRFRKCYLSSSMWYTNSPHSHPS
jgi:hypothetical protein